MRDALYEDGRVLFGAVVVELERVADTLVDQIDTLERLTGGHLEATRPIAESFMVCAVRSTRYDVGLPKRSSDARSGRPARC